MKDIKLNPVKSLADYLYLGTLLTRCRFYLTYDTSIISYWESAKKYIKKVFSGGSQTKYYFANMLEIIIGSVSMRRVDNSIFVELALESDYRDNETVKEVVKQACLLANRESIFFEVLFNDYMLRVVLGNYGFQEVGDTSGSKTILLVKKWK